jgi:succinate dehydrogenase / fumarate reductase membrane anchor subunit
MLAGSDYTRFVTWLSRPHAALFMTLLLIALFSHLALGLRVVIEDYVHSWIRFPMLLAVRFGCFALAAAGILATLRILFRNY